MKSNKVILTIPDLQAPYHYKYAIDVLREAKKEHKPTHVVCLGDETDQYTLSKYASDPDAKSAGDEYHEAMAFWKGVYAIFPKAYAVTSNHVARVIKRRIEAGIPSYFMKTIWEFMQAPKGWQWSDWWDIDGIRFEHGERAKGAVGLRNLVIANMQSTTIGHQHECPGTTWVSNGEKTLWGLNAGCLVDQYGYGLRYTSTNKHKPVLGYGVIKNGIPQFIPI